MTTLTFNLQHLTDPRAYLHKQKLRALSLDPAKVNETVELITPSGLKYQVAKNISNLELIELIQDLIDATYDAMTEWADQINIYQNHFPLKSATTVFGANLT